jgi:hypothetical protein
MSRSPTDRNEVDMPGSVAAVESRREMRASRTKEKLLLDLEMIHLKESEAL